MVSPAAIFANMIAVPLSFFVLTFGLMSLIAAPLWTQGTVLFNNANWLATKSLLAVVKVFSLLPGSYLFVEMPHLGSRPACELTAFDVDSGGAIHLRAGSCDWLIDCGNQRQYPRIVLPGLRARGVDQLDALVLTHGDAAHIGGAVALLDDLRPEEVIDSPLKDRSSKRKDLREHLAAMGFGRALSWRGDVFHLNDVTSVQVLYPPTDLKRSNADDKALVLRVETAAVRTLLMADSGFATEQWLIEHEPNLHADVIIKGWHSKDVSGTPEFLNAVSPQVVVCTAPNFGVPASKLDEWVQSVTQRGITVFRQDECGAVDLKVRFDGRFALSGFVNGQTFAGGK
jgi:competence protein ComEC